MTKRARPDARLAAALAALVSERTGIRPEALRTDAIEELALELQAEAASVDAALDQVVRRHRRLVARLLDVAPVGETYFFRQPEHFAVMAAEIVGKQGSRATHRAWSAGCATGEEAWSLASTLAGARGLEGLSVLGTDVRPTAIDTARRGSYPSRGFRSGRDRLASLDPFEPGPGDRLAVRADLRARVSFEVHNLLDGPPPGAPFDLVLCRNVLVYFSPEARARATQTLVQALAPDGVVLLGPMDMPDPPGGLAPWGPPELQAFVRTSPPCRAVERRERRSAHPPPRTPPSPGTVGRSRPDRPAGPVAAHIMALAYLERGHVAKARSMLDGLVAEHQDYLPGLVERALLHTREGEPKKARALMRAVLDQARRLDPGADVLGPERGTVELYVTTAQSFLDGAPGGRSSAPPPRGRASGGRS